MQTVKIDRIINTDCARLMSKIASQSVDLILTDPPYGICYRSKSRRLSRQTVEGDEAPYIWWLHEAARVLKDNGSLLCFTRWDVIGAWHTAIEYAGLRVRSCLVWDKGVHGMGNTKAQFAPQHELCLFATKADFEFPNGRPVDVIRVAKMPSADMIHPTQKPVALFEQLIKVTTLPGALVVDPFAGSGTTAIAAINTDRHFLCSEIDHTHFTASCRRIATHKREYALRAEMRDQDPIKP
ncbi:DNA adenine methyltransferase YhdJ [bioreactor metagenome]|uniref:DNA adenine methyltransferase YhdJ n=1 Tax=bioreactor metagenome TaxID=1076179 RepID=A0A644VRZ4_9ZZZZ